MIAVLLIAVVVTSVFSLAFTSKTASIRTDRRAVALQGMTQVREKIKAYITDDRNATGPNTNWHMPEDACGSGCPANCHPLDVCEHDVSQFLPARYTAAPRNMTMTYTVTADAATDGGFKVVFKTMWDE